MMTDSVGSIMMPYWAENFADTSKGLDGWQDTSTQSNRIRKTVSSDFAIFAKDDFKMSRRLTLNLGRALRILFAALYHFGSDIHDRRSGQRPLWG
jgi:hypothetical protein